MNPAYGICRFICENVHISQDLTKNKEFLNNILVRTTYIEYNEK